MRKKSKKVVVAILCGLLILTIHVQTGIASDSNLAIEEEISTAKWSYTRLTKTGLTISSAGKATCLASITGYPGTTTKVEINMYLQQLKNGSWTNVSSWSKTFNTYTGTLENTKTVTKGYSYRVKVSYYAYSGTKKENIVAYSSTVKY